MTLFGYTSRNIPNPTTYAKMLERRIQAKKAGDKKTADALKLVANTTYGAMLNKFNDLYDPLMGRSVCITGQLFLLELAIHLNRDIEGLKVVQLNTDGIMVEFDDSHTEEVNAILREWQERTGFELEEDSVKKFVQKDVNGYVEIQDSGKIKAKGGVLVRGISTAGAYNVNNNAVVIAEAVKNYLAYGTPIRETIEQNSKLIDYQIIAKASSKFGNAYHEINGEPVEVQKVNRVYACKDYHYGTLYKKNLETGTLVKQAGLPPHCIVDNGNTSAITAVDKEWYINEAERYVKDFLGIKPPKRNTRKVNSIKKKLLQIL